MKKLKRIVYLLGIMMTGFLISACVQEPRPPHVMMPVQHYSRAAEPLPIAKENHYSGPVATRYPVSHANYTRQVNQVKPVIQPDHVKRTRIPPNTPMTQHFAIGGFDQVVISGRVSGTVTGGQSQDQLVVNGTVETLKGFSARTQRGILFINSSDPVTISLSLATPVRALANNSNGNIEIKDIANQSTKLGLGGNGVTSLEGNLVLSRVNISDNATLHAYWVDSSNLHVVAQGNAKLFLAGIVTDLDIIATGDAEVDAKYLRADNAYIRTVDHADVGITVNRALSTLSTDNSTVYYYDNSRVGLHYLDYHGSALRMKGIPNYAIYKKPYGR